MTLTEGRDSGDAAHRDETASEPLADRPAEAPSKDDDDSKEPGGPFGNPGVDEESLRKQQEESSERNE